jgi:hypothetical protein
MQNEKDQDPQGRQLNDPPKEQQDQLNERTKQIGKQNQGDMTGQAQAPARDRDDDQGPSNSGDAGFGSSGTATQDVSEVRIEQMSHADGSSDDPNPDV